MQSSGALAVYSKDILLSAEIGLGERCEGYCLRKSAGIIRIFPRNCSTKSRGTSLTVIARARPVAISYGSKYKNGQFCSGTVLFSRPKHQNGLFCSGASVFIRSQHKNGLICSGTGPLQGESTKPGGFVLSIRYY